MNGFQRLKQEGELTAKEHGRPWGAVMGYTFECVCEGVLGGLAEELSECRLHSPLDGDQILD